MPSLGKKTEEMVIGNEGTHLHQISNSKGGIGSALGLQSKIFEKKVKNMVGVFTYVGYQELVKNKEFLEGRMLGTDHKTGKKILVDDQKKDLENEKNEKLENLQKFQSQDEDLGFGNVQSEIQKMEEVKPSLILKSQFSGDGNKLKNTFEKIKSATQPGEVHNVLKNLQFNPFLDYEEDEVNSDETVYFMPMLQIPMIDVETDYDFITSLFGYLSTQGSVLNHFSLISGYLNPTPDMMKYLKDIQAKEKTYVGAAPEANSFFDGGFPKNLIPFFYQNVLKQLKSEDKNKSTKVYQFTPNIKKPFTAQSFHSKYLFLENDQGEYLMQIGSGNYAQRSYYKDNEINFYVYSKNEKLKKMALSEKKYIMSDCQELKEDKEKRAVTKRLIDNLFWGISRWNNIC